MIKQRFIAAAIAFSALPALAQSSFTELVVFGDSLLDSGNFGIRFTNQLTDGSGDFAPIAPQLFAQSLGLALEPAVAGGTNYAVGGYQTGQIFNSIAGTGIVAAGSRPAYLVENAGAVAEGTLILMDGGGNDLRDILINDSANVATRIPAAAQTFVNSIGALHLAGADYIMVGNVPDLGNTPGVRLAEIASPGAVQGFSAATAGFNQAVNTFATLGLSDANIIPVDLAGFVDYVQDNAERYGLAFGELDVSSAFFQPPGSVLLDQRYMCYQATVSGGIPDCVEHPVFGINGAAPDPRQLFFNDALHPTEIASEIFGDYLLDIVAAPMKVGLLPELALAATRTQLLVSGDELRRSRWGDVEGRLFVAGDVVNNEYEQPGAPETDSHSLTIGKTFSSGESLVYGLALTLANQELDLTGTDFESDSWGISGLMGYRHKAVFVDAVAGIVSLAYDDLERQVKLGSQTLTATGDTDGHARTLDILAGYDLIASQTLHVAPAIGMQYINSTVDAYRETGGEISNYQWGEQRRKSLQWRYGVVAGLDLNQTVNLFVELFGNQEQEDDAEFLTISNPNFNSPSYRLPSFIVEDDSFVSAALGGSIRVAESARLNLTYNYSDRGDGYQQLLLSYSMSL